MSTQQKDELFQLEQVLPILFKEQHYTLLQPLPPLPDVIIQVDGKKIGIELTDILIDEHSKEREANQNAILNEAQKKFENLYHFPLHVEINFIESANWKKQVCRDISSFLADIVLRLVMKIEKCAEHKNRFHVYTSDIVHTHIENISIITYPNEFTISCWSSMTGLAVPNISINKIQEIINRKSRNISDYLSGCDEVWLLMIETGSPSSYFSRFDILKEVVFTSGFAQTLIGRHSKGELLTLKTTRLL